MSHANGGSVLAADFPKAARKETEETHSALKDMIDQFTLMVAQIDFPVTAVAPAAALLETTFLVQLRDANDNRMLFGDNVASRVFVDENAGTATNAELSGDGVTWGTSGVIIPLFKGQGTVYARATTTGTVVASLVDTDGTGLTLGGDATVTFS